MGKKTKADIVRAVCHDTGFSARDVSKVVSRAFDAIADALSQGDSVELRGFGVFEVRRRKGRRSALNPRTGNVFAVEDHDYAAFRAGKDLKNRIW